ncbi:MAG: tRNA (adenosine(37)-N6)-dimethylallyltransferase MiaA [Verrucomicrobia bacterium]|nr:MAG: tRNA (adenosine(37)-N6)-dimethylallyltransferase MiaA [Verrucomicrobiota bacterium]
MRRAFFIVGPTATGKSELGADVARELGAEIVSADAFQIYHGLDLLTAKPDASTLAKAPHHLIGTTPLDEEMNAEKYRRAATHAINEINSRGRLAIIVGGSGLYIKALSYGLAPLPECDPLLREKLNAMSLNELRLQLLKRDPEAARKIDMKNRRRVVRALEICLLTGKPASTQREQWSVAASLREAQRAGVMAGRRGASHSEAATGVFVFRDREELYARINQRVEAMFEKGVIEEVRASRATSATASQMIGLREIRELLEGRMSLLQCIAQIQQATRRYAKRQLTWFRRQTSFSPLNLSLLSHNEAVKWILLRMLSEVRTRDD